MAPPSTSSTLILHIYNTPSSPALPISLPLFVSSLWWPGTVGGQVIDLLHGGQPPSRTILAPLGSYVLVQHGGRSEDASGRSAPPSWGRGGSRMGSRFKETSAAVPQRNHSSAAHSTVSSFRTILAYPEAMSSFCTRADSGTRVAAPPHPLGDAEGSGWGVWMISAPAAEEGVEFLEILHSKDTMQFSYLSPYIQLASYNSRRFQGKYYTESRTDIYGYSNSDATTGTFAKVL
ncbi:hypothetical protein BC832DRAFT_616422 [Gaertneriomyces semiglobifer]|nr:hypothetical protein BC832DRAFT_616422 [Gaertneriomyces semiglobifer]